MINETLARRAHEGMSFSEYKPGRETSEYNAMVSEAREIAENRKAQVDEYYHPRIDRLLALYCGKLAAWTNRKNEIAARVPSVMITGAGNFPVRKKEKQVAAMDKHWGEWDYIKNILHRIKSVGAAISADQENAVELLRKKLKGLEDAHAEMKRQNAHWRKYRTMVGYGDITAEEAAKLDAQINNNYGWERQPRPAYSLQNSNANIKRVKERIAELEETASAEINGWTFNGGKVEINKAENRVQIIHDAKPDEATRARLKSNGFRWSPRGGCWQRMLNKNGVWAAKKLTAAA
jgi:flagellar motility protein MotE (MotC chaperone)